jgi:transposase-like protein
MECEVDYLCGEAYSPKEGGDYRRAGSEQGRAYYNGESHGLIRPRVRKKGANGREEEAHLETYQVARSRQNLHAEIMKMAEGGMSLRGVERMKREGCSASTAQKAWIEESAKAIVKLRERDLSQEEFYGLMIDGVVLSREVVVIVAVGFCTDGRKMVLDFVRGHTESYELCRELMGRLMKRGFGSATGRLLAVLDGAEALSKAIREFFPGAEVQRCWVHKERNLHAYLNKKDHGECSQLLDRVRKAEGAADGEAAYGELEKFLGARNQAAVQSLKEGGAELLTIHRLNVPATLNVTFLSTNLIENVMLNFRRHTNRVTKWDPKTDQVERWTSTALLMAEEGFRRIRHHEDLPKLFTALGGLRESVAPGCVPDSTLRVADPSDQTSSTPPGARGKRAL